MPIPDDIAAIRANPNLNEDEKRGQVYALKAQSLLDVILNGKPAPEPIPPLLGRQLVHKGFHFTINAASETPEHSLFLDVTFTKPPAQPVTHQITIVNPPVLPANQTGNERQDLITALHEMLEGFV